jgi:hypothetical protein
MIDVPFVAIGPLAADSPVYIERKADFRVLRHIRRMQYVQIIAPRRQGKTSLIYRMRGALRNSVYTLAYVDIASLISSNEATWYQDLAARLVSQLREFLKCDYLSTPTDARTWRSFLLDLVTSEPHAADVKPRLIIAIDELGSIPHDWAEDFFRVLREVYTIREVETNFQYLTFVLAGAIDPRDLISDSKISPFNVAQWVNLEDFDYEQVKQLVMFLRLPADETTSVAERVYHWTGGQPHLTQMLCLYLTKNGGNITPGAVDAAVERLFREDVTHFPRIARDLEADPDLPDYTRQVIASRVKFAPSVNPQHYRLAYIIGVIKPDENGWCRIRNRIYEQMLAFELNWKLWKSQITENIERSGRASQHEITSIPDSLWTKVVSRFKDASELPVTITNEEIRLERGAQAVASWNHAWSKAGEMLAASNKPERIDLLVEMADILAEAVGLHWDHNWHPFGMLHATTITDHALQVNIPSRFPIVFIPSAAISSGVFKALVGLCQLMKLRQYFSIIVPLPSDESFIAKVAQLRELLRGSLYADDFVVLSPDDLFRVFIAHNPARQIAQCIARQVSPSAISPFVVGDPVAGTMFFGRDREIRDITSGLATRSFAVIGNRRIGKSSLLRQVKLLLDQSQVYAPTLVNLQAVRDLPGLYRYLEEEPHIQFRATEMTAEAFRSFVDHLIQQAGGRKIVLLIDESDALLLYDEENNYQLSDVWRELSENNRSLFIFAGHRVLARMRRDARSDFYNFADFLSLGCLTESQAKHLISDPLAEMGIELSDASAILNRVWEVSSGHPNVIQHIGNRLLKELDRGEYLIHPYHLQRVLSNYEFVDYFLDTIWGGNVPSKEQGVSSLERAILLLTGGTKGFTEHDIARTLSQSGFRVDVSNVHNALDMITTFGLLARDGPVYTHTMPYLLTLLHDTKQMDYWLEQLRRKVN